MRLTIRHAAAIAAALVSLSAPAAASATAAPEEITSSVNKGLTYVKGLQSSSTGAISGFGGDWALTAFAARKSRSPTSTKAVEPAPMHAAGTKAKWGPPAGPAPARPRPTSSERR